MKDAHVAKYRALNKKFGVVWNQDSHRFVNETLETLSEKYAEDEYLNNVPLRLWDRLALLMNVPFELSLAERVCMQKQAAIDLIQEEGRSI